MKLIKDCSEEKTKLFLVGNKMDLESCREVRKSIAEEFSRKNDFAGFVECSAKDDQVDKKVFGEVAKTLYNIFFRSDSVNTNVRKKIKILRGEDETEDYSCCCKCYKCCGCCRCCRCCRCCFC